MADLDTLIAQKQQAVEEEDFLRAAELKKQIEELQQKNESEDTERQAKIEALTKEKSEAVANEDYLRAAELKTEIESLENGGGASKAVTPKKTKKAATTSSSKKKASAPSTPAPSTSSTDPVAPPSASSSVNNPIKSDPKLKSLIEQLDDVNNAREFKNWKSSFLNRFEDFLEEDGGPPAQNAYGAFRTSMKTFSKQVQQVQGFVEKASISQARTTVKGRNALNEMNKLLVDIIEEERQLIPAKSAQEKERGYTKFHLGAVLVRDGFQEYQRMNTCCEILKVFQSTTLVNIADKQQMEEMENYDKSMHRFRDIMADLGLYEVMMKCWQFGEEGEEFIFVDLKTGAMGGISIKHCIDAGFVHTIKNEKTNSDIGFKEAITDEEDKEAVLALVREAIKL